MLPFVSPNGLASVAGRNLADSVGANPGTTRVSVNGVSASILFIQVDATDTTFISFQIPPQTAVGNATFVVSRGGVSSAPFTFRVSQFAPQLAAVAGSTLARMQHADGTTLDAGSPAFPGEKVKCVVSGLGAGTPTTPVVMLGGFSVPVESIRANDPIFDFPGVLALTFVVPPQMLTTTAPLSISLGILSSAIRTIPIRSKGLSVSQSGVTFRAVVGSPAVLERTLPVISSSGSITWFAVPATVSGGGWLQVTTPTGISDEGRPAPTLQIVATVGTLAVGDYYGTVTVHSPESLVVLTVVLSVLPPAQSPGPIVDTTRLAFVGVTTLPSVAKIIRVTNPSTAPLTFTVASTFSSTTSWFTVLTSGDTIFPATPGTISVQPNTGLAPGNYTGTLTLTFSDGSQRVVNLVASLGGACTGTRFFASLSPLGANFVSPVGWPANLDAFVIDDCGTAVTSAAVSVSFSNGDPPLGLVQVQPGHWANTWTPRNPMSANLVVTLKVQTFGPEAQGVTTISGSAPANLNVPIVFNGGVVGTASYVASPAPGTLISLFGAELADDLFISTLVPRPTQILTTQVLLGGRNLPLLFVSKGQINALVPYELKSNTTHSLIVKRGNAISTPETLTVLDSQPAVFTLDQSGKGQGHIYRATSSGLQILAATGAAVTAGDVLVVYCAGLGEVNPPSVAGSPARTDVLQNTANRVTATIGGVNATVQFAGLTPSFTGLYQVNLMVPGGVTPGAAVELLLSSAGQVSKAVTLAVR